MSGYDAYKNYDPRVPSLDPHGSRSSLPQPRGFHDNPAFVQYIEEPGQRRPGRNTQGYRLPSLELNGKPPPPSPQKSVGMEGRSRKPRDGVPLDSGLTYPNPAYSDRSNSSSISGQGAIMGNMPVISVKPENGEKKKKGSGADAYVIQPAKLYPELNNDDGEDNEFADRDISTNPPEGRKLYFEDGVRRIDYVLSWSTKKDDKKKDGYDTETSNSKNRFRQVFERNLEVEGLQLEYDIKEGRDIQYVKLHATWEVLSRYAEVMKLRMPMEEVPEEIKSNNLWEMMTGFMSNLMRPFQLNEEKVPMLPKKFTCVFERNKEYLFAIPANRDLFFSHATRSRIVDYILRRQRYEDRDGETFAFGIARLLRKNVYAAAYPLHEGSWKPWTKASMRRLLFEHWAHWRNFYKLQPLDYVRTYFGEKVGLYFAWLGFYTWMLIPASAIGLAVFLYSLFTLQDNIIANETCEKNFTMCPQCDLRCPYWNYNASCSYVRASHLFDNNATVAFAFFMSIWCTLFLEFWKREQAGIQFRWNLLNFEEEEEPPRPEYLMKLKGSKYRKIHKVSGKEEPYLPFWRRRVPVYVASYSVMMFMVAVAIGAVVGVIVYRMAVLSALYLRDEEILYKNASLVTTATAACINLAIIFIMNYVYDYVGHKLTDWECCRTQSVHDKSLTIKLFVLQFVNYYSSIIYIAFFKGRFLGRPGEYNKLFGARQEECSAGSCLIELAIQLAIIFVGKQLIQNNLMEIIVPRLLKWMKERFFYSDDDKANKLKQPWEKDYLLVPIGTRSLFNEYLEMCIQFGFVTIFVAAFPLAPLFALLNNIIEIRSDANKFVTQLQRPMAVRAQDIGIWYEILYAISRLSVITNALIISFTSGFVHRLVYVNSKFSDGTLHGYVDHTLSYFNVSDFTEYARPVDNLGKFNSVEICRYMDYRDPPWSPEKYQFSKSFWHVVAAQFMFIFIFENFVILITSTVDYAIPDIPRKLREHVRREAYLTNEIILKTELMIARGNRGELSDDQLKDIRRRVRGPLMTLFSKKRNGGRDTPTEEESKV